MSSRPVIGQRRPSSALSASELRRLGLRLERADHDRMPPPRVEADSPDCAACPRSSCASASVISAWSAVGERPRVGGQAEPLVAGGPARGEVGRQILVGVAEAVGARHPDLLAAQPLAQGLQHADLVVDAVHPLAAARRVLDHDVAPLRADHALDGDLVGPEVLPPFALRAPDRVEGVEQGAVRAVVGAEVERGQQLAASSGGSRSRTRRARRCGRAGSAGCRAPGPRGPAPRRSARRRRGR